MLMNMVFLRPSYFRITPHAVTRHRQLYLILTCLSQ
jgi:hypothetical protein